MFEMTSSSKYHCNFIFVAIINSSLYRSSRLNYSSNSLRFSYSHSQERKKCVTAIDAPCKSNPKFLAFSIALAMRVDSDVCPVPDRDQSSVFRKTIVVRFLYIFEVKF
jgi:hypothetical protein